MEKNLYADAGSGIAFILAGKVLINEKPLPQGVVMLPVNRRADKMIMQSSSILAGIRLHPAMGYKVLGRHYDEPELITREHDMDFNLYNLFNILRQQVGSSQPDFDTSSQNNQKRVEILYHWAKQYLTITNESPDSVEQVLAFIDDGESLAELSHRIKLSQRQIERLFKTRLGMTAKNYQRIIRIRKAILFIQENKQMPLAEVAVELGFSDQAHMTREFKAIACVTPGKL